ncbi:MAG: winged helix DNA-binding domain-containing protein, partial [Chitinophagaceae bacterium]
MTRKQLLTTRLCNQQLSQQTFDKTPDLVSWMGAVQAQDYAMAKWAVGQRLSAATDQQVEDAINKGDLLRTHVLRPTWHLVHRDDIRWMLKLTAPQILKQMSYYDRQLGITPREVSRALSLFAKSLAGAQLTRPELQAIFTKAKFNCESMRFGHLLMYAEMNALICSGARKGKHNSYALLDELMPSLSTPDKNASLLLLARKYFQSHGPATVKDFIWWSGLNAADGNEAVRLLGDALSSDTIDGQAYLFFESPAKVKNKKMILLLPNYDEYTV